MSLIAEVPEDKVQCGLKDHFFRTKELFEYADKYDIDNWFLNKGYYPEQQIIPPNFTITGWEIQEEPCFSYEEIKKKKIDRQSLVSLSYPKTNLVTTRDFSAIWPEYYHDLAWYLIFDDDNRKLVTKILFPENTKIYSYSIPTPLIDGFSVPPSQTKIGNLRAGRIIYQWIEMAEKAIVTESCQYKYLVKTDISNFYPSIYTHIFEWIFDFYDNKKLGKIIDKLVSYSNCARTNGISIGSAMSDFLGEIILAHIDHEVSINLDIDFIGGRFKDDYRILCKSKEHAQKVLTCLNEKLQDFHLRINEEKTDIYHLPEGLYRGHMMEYENLIPDYNEIYKIPFKSVEKDLKNLIYLQNKYSNTSLIEKYLASLINKKNDQLKVNFFKGDRLKQNKQRILICISLLFYLFDISIKSYPVILGIIEQIVVQDQKNGCRVDISNTLIEKLKTIIDESGEKDTFVKIWTLYFIQKHRSYLGGKLVDELIEIISQDDNEYVISLIKNKNEIYLSHRFNIFGIEFFKDKEKIRTESLTKYLDLFSGE